jgi:N-hydroxyarylamine O-acetyltransferase
MLPEHFKLTDYLQRIAYTGEVKLDYATLKQLMICHLQSVPFENLDVLAGKPISLDPQTIVDKIVYRRRGGYCYEVNGVFAMALDSIGFPYRIVACRPMFYPVRRPRTHAALVVRVEGQDYLVDLGFGSYGIRQPMNLAVLDTPVTQDYDQYKLTIAEDGDYVLSSWVDGEWLKQHAFNLTPMEWLDFVPANWFNSTHPDTVFTQKPLILLFTPAGKRILFGDSFKQIEQGKTTVQSVSPEQQTDILAEYFHLQFS